MSSIYLFFFFAICFKSTFGFAGLKKEYCTFKDDVCLTQAVKQHIYAMFVAGIPGVEPTDPMKIDKISVDLPDSVFELHESLLAGFKECEFQKLKLTHNDSIFDYELLCPHLNLQSAYQVKSNTETAVEKGKCEINYTNYFIVIRGEYDKLKDDSGKLFIHITDYKLELTLQNEVTYKYKDVANDNKEKPNEYYKNLEELSRQAIMETFMNKFMDHLKAFLLAIPMEDLHFRYV